MTKDVQQNPLATVSSMNSVPLLFQVKLGFSDSVALPGSAVRLHLQAAPGSLCSIRAVDQSILLLRPEAELSRDSVSHFSAEPC